MKSFFGMLALIGVASVSECVWALDVNPKMGKPTQEELSMTTYEPDPEAEAVVLYSSRRTDLQCRASNFLLINEYKKRIKILKEDGKRYGDIEIVVYDEEDNSFRDHLSGLKAVTYNLEDGKITKTKLNGELKSEQRLDQYYKIVKFSMPNVKVGSVLEIEYGISSEDIATIETWYAEERIPVFYTQYEVKIPDWFTFSTDVTGQKQIKCSRTEENYTEFVGNSQLSTNAVLERYEGRQLSRLVDEDYIYCIDDYRTKVTKDITNYTIPGVIYKSYNQDWSQEIGNLMGSSYFGRLCKRNNPFENEIQAIKWPEDFSLNQKIDSLRQMLWSRYSWDETYSLYARNIRNLNKEMMGTSATLNFALMNMLNDAGIKAFPVVMNNRLRGRLPIRPSRKYLKAMTLAVYNPADSAYVYVDAGSNDYPVGVIPSQFLVPRAFLLNPDAKQFFTKDLRDVCKGTTIDNLVVGIAADGTLTGKVSVAHRGLDAALYRKRYKAATDESEFVQKMAAKWDAEISDYTINHVHSTNESVGELFQIQKQLDVDGDRIYLNPFLGINLESPFKAESRELPVEFDSNSIFKYSISIKLPEGYEVEELPNKLNMKMPDGKFVVRVSFSPAEGNLMSVSLNINRTTLLYPKNDYELLRSIYTELEKTANSRIVLKKVQ